MATVSILLSIPAVQTKLGKTATNYLKNSFNVDIRIHKIDLSYLGNVKLRDVLILDHHSDTLIYAHKLGTSIFSYRNILKNKLKFSQVSLSNFELNHKTYKGENNDNLSIFVEKFEDTTSTEPSGFLLTSTKLKLNEGFVQIIDENIENENPVFFKNIRGEAREFKIEGPKVSAKIRDLAFEENHGIEVRKFSCDFFYTTSFMHFLNAKINTETSSISAVIKFNYNREDFSDFNNKVNIEATISKATVSLLDLKKFYNELGTEDVLHFSTKLHGQLNNLTAENLELNSDQHAVVIGNINFKNAFDKEQEFSMDADFKNVTSDYNHLKLLLPNILGKKLPVIFKKLGRFSMNGHSFIKENFMIVDLNMKSDIGAGFANLVITNIGDINNAEYIGHVKLMNFNLGKVVGDPLIGEFSMEADVDGKGFSLEKMNTSIKGLVSKHQYKGYTYSNIKLNGVVSNKHFNGEMEVNDDNIKLNFNGLADFSKKVYTFDFKTIVDYCDLNKLNLFKRDSISNIKGNIEINVKGNSIDDLVGEINFKKSLYTNQKDNYFFEDFNITSTFEEKVRTITINSSEISDGYLKGNFKFKELGKLAKNSLGSIYTNYTPFKVSPGQNLEFRFRIHTKIMEVLLPEVSLAPNSFIRGNINSDNNLFRLTIKSPQVIAFKNIINNLNLTIDNKNPLFNTQLMVEELQTKYYDISDLHLVNMTLNDTLFFRTEFKGGEDHSEEFNLLFYHTFNKNNEMVLGVQKSDFVYKNNRWRLNPENDEKNNIVYNSKTKTFNFNSFLLTSKNQKIDFEGKMIDSTQKDLNFRFKEVKVASILPEIDSLSLKGFVNGSLNYKQFNKQLLPTAKLSITKFNINNVPQGNLVIDISGKNSITKYGVNISLEKGAVANFGASGEIDFTEKKPTLDVIVDFEDFKLNAFSPLGQDVFTDIRGSAYGSIHLTGLLDNPTMKGELFLDQAGLFVPYLNVNYDFYGTSIVELYDQTFKFDDVILRESTTKTLGKLTGTIQHKKFDEWKLDLDIKTKNLLVLNTVEQENAAYYGTGFLEGNATIKGKTDKLVIDVVGKTKGGTRFVIPISDVKTAEASELIRFVHKNGTKDDDELRRKFLSEKLKGLSMNFNLEITKDAVVEMVLDKATGSFLKGSGTGNLQIELDTKDKFDMYGDFIVDNGIYNFKYGGFISKPFTVKKGGSISWSGNPFTANLNIEAVHRVSANPMSLLENITTNRKIPIDLITRFSGELFNSEREFDIEIPNSSSTVASELAFKLNNDNINSKTVQFISLLVSGSFYNESNLSVNSSTALYGTGFDMLSSAFDNIVNQGNNRFKLRPEYTVGERGKVDNVNIEDQLALALDYQVNDRIIINGKVGVPIGSKNQTDVIGEVNIEFLLNEDGTLRSTIFNRQNEIQYTEEEQGYTQGVGLIYQIDFDNVAELLEKLSLKKKKIKDSVKNMLEIDTLDRYNKLIQFKNKKSDKNE